VWDLVSLLRHWPEWGTSIRSVHSAAERVDPGVSGTVETVVGARLPFTITDVDPGRSWTWNVAGLPATGHHVTAVDENSSRLVFTVAWPLAPYAVVLRHALRRVKAIAEHR
jgi:hypothetical protein